MIYELDDGGYVIASHGAWLPGRYATKSAARWAFQFDDAALLRLRERVNTAERRLITADDLRKGRDQRVD